MKSLMKRLPKLTVTVFIVLFLLLVMTPPTFARGGGGGGKGGAGAGIFAVILYGIYYLIWSTYVGIRKMGVRTLLSKLCRWHKKWDSEAIRQRVEQVYYTVQETWARNNLEPARQVLSTSELQEFQRILDGYKSEHRRNVLESVDLLDMEIVGFDDKDGDHRDRLHVLVKGSMVDYFVDTRTGLTITEDSQSESSAKQSASFWEVWTFIWRDETWVLDAISQNTGIFDIMALPCQSTDQTYTFQRSRS